MKFREELGSLISESEASLSSKGFTLDRLVNQLEAIHSLLPRDTKERDEIFEIIDELEQLNAFKKWKNEKLTESDIEVISVCLLKMRNMSGIGHQEKI